MSKGTGYTPRHNKWRNEYQRVCYILNGGVYRIRNKANGRCYFGSSQNLRDRFCKHLDRLKIGKHYNQQLQNDFDKFGRKAFIYEPLVGSRDVGMCLALEASFISEDAQTNRNPYNQYKREQGEGELDSDVCYSITNEAIKAIN